MNSTGRSAREPRADPRPVAQAHQDAAAGGMAVTRPPLDRRRLGRELSVAGRADAAAILALAPAAVDQAASRIGFTGPPGAGKSTLVSRLADRYSHDDRRVGILAIDPSSPVSGGSILGDRIRMDELSLASEVYIRSVPSRSANDGLTPNVAEMLNIMDRHDFDDVLIETVGIGQTDHAVHALVDTVVLVLVPESGDTIQAMKAGILELAHIYVVNKADRPNASQMRASLEGVLALGRDDPTQWRPPVVLTAAADNDLAGLEDAIAAHREWLATHCDPVSRRRRRARQLAESVIAAAVAEAAGELAAEHYDGSPDDLYVAYLEQLRAKAGATQG